VRSDRTLDCRAGSEPTWVWEHAEPTPSGGSSCGPEVQLGRDAEEDRTRFNTCEPTVETNRLLFAKAAYNIGRDPAPEFFIRLAVWILHLALKQCFALAGNTSLVTTVLVAL
jgi:hypothetical protein